MAVGGHALIKIYGKTKLTPKKLIDTAVIDAKLNKKDEFKDNSFYAAIIEESHLIAHKFDKFWLIDAYTCGNLEQLVNAVNSIVSNFNFDEIYSFYTPRGIRYGAEFENNLKIDMPQLNPGYDHIMLDMEVVGEKIKKVDQIVEYVSDVFDGDVIARYQFAPYGASGVIRSGREMVTFHSWPEYNLITIDFIGFRRKLHDVKRFVDRIDGEILKEWNLSYGKSEFRY